MEILGIGPSELLFIVLIAIIVLGPKDMQKAGRTIGKWLRSIVTSDGWKLFQQTSREIQTLPNRLMREAAIEELKEVQKDLRQPIEPPAAPVSVKSEGSAISGPDTSPEPKILPAQSSQQSTEQDPDQHA